MAFGFYFDENMTRPVGINNNGMPLFHHNFYTQNGINNTYQFSWYLGEPETGQIVQSAIDGGDLILRVSDDFSGSIEVWESGSKYVYENDHFQRNGYLYKAINSGYMPDIAELSAQLNSVQYIDNVQIKCLGKMHPASELKMRLSSSSAWADEVNLGKQIQSGAAIQVFFQWQNTVSDEHYRPNIPQFAVNLQDDFIVVSD